MTGNVFSSTHVRVTTSERDKFHASARDAILLARGHVRGAKEIFDFRTGNYVEWKPNRGAAGLASPLKLATRCLVMSGAVRDQDIYSLAPIQIARLVMGADPAQLGLGGIVAGGAAYHVSGMFNSIMLDAANVSLRKSFDDARTTYQVWARRGEDIQDFKPVHRVISGELSDPRAIPEDGEFEETTLTDGKESYKLTVWGSMFSCSWQLVVNDQLRAFMEMPEKMGHSMRRKMNKLVCAELKGNPQLADTGALFNATALSSAGGHNNLTTGALTTVADYIGAWNTMTKKMGEQKGLDADSGVLNLLPRFVIYPPALRGIIRQTLGSPSGDTTNPGITNIWQQGLEPVEEGELGGTTPDGSDTAFYQATDPMDCDTIEYAHLAGMDAPVIEQSISFERLAMQRRMYLAFGTKALDFRGLQKHTGA